MGFLVPQSFRALPTVLPPSQDVSCKEHFGIFRHKPPPGMLSLTKPFLPPTWFEEFPLLFLGLFPESTYLGKIEFF